MDAAATTHVMLALTVVLGSSHGTHHSNLMAIMVWLLELHVRIELHITLVASAMYYIHWIFKECGKYRKTIYLLIKHCSATTWQLLPHYLTVSHLYKWAAYMWYNMSDQKTKYKHRKKMNPGVPSPVKAQMCKTLIAMDSW